MARNEYLTKLTQLQQNHQSALREAQAFTDDSLSAKGLQDRRTELSDRANQQYKAHLDTLRGDFETDARRAQESGSEAIPAPPADTSTAWAKVKMLLDAGKSLQEIVRSADTPQLHAIAEWGPTYLQAQAATTRETGLAGLRDTPVDPKHLQRSITKRWTEVLDSDAAGKVQAGLAAEVDAAQFTRTAQHLEAKISGSNPGVSDMHAAIDAQYVGEAAARDLGSSTESEPQESKGGAA
ncbi:hypothetical protein ACX80A_02545 [Arthrobacter sp. TMN-50]